MRKPARRKRPSSRRAVICPARASRSGPPPKITKPVSGSACVTIRHPNSATRASSASAPLITTLVDASGLVIYLLIAKVLLSQLH